MTPSITLPFSIPYVYQGLATASGVALLNNDNLTLEFEVKDCFLGVLRSGVQSVQLPIAEISEVELKSGLFNTQLLVQTTNMQRLQNFPEKESGRIVLNLTRKDQETAQQFVVMLRLKLSEVKLNQSSQVTV